MFVAERNPTVKLIGTCPSISRSSSPSDYIYDVSRALSWADENGWEAVLIYTDYRQVDPWLVAGLVMQHGSRVRPLVATQPLDMHPAAVARTIVSLSRLYGRPVYLNMVAGGFPRDLSALCDRGDHDDRYYRLVEYVEIIQRLVTSKAPVTYDGRFYSLNALQLGVGLPADLTPVFTISGSSSAGLKAAKQIGARAIQYLRPIDDYQAGDFPADLEHGTRLGIIVRERSEDAWSVAVARYPEDEEGTALREYSSQVADSVWAKELSKVREMSASSPYFLRPYKTYKTSCPYLVGSSKEVAQELAAYIRAGIETFLLEEPDDAEDARRITATFAEAAAIAHSTG